MVKLHMPDTKVSTILPISIVIPTYYEEVWLPRLLESIKNQVLKPYEVIVADAQSKDRTREIAKLYGAIVVEGGKIAFGRNAGARVAKSEYIIFMDADTELSTELSLGAMFIEFLKSGADLASPKFSISSHKEPMLGKVAGTVIYHSWNQLLKLQSELKTKASAPGITIVTKKSVFESVNGFDESITIGEDTDFFSRAKAKGYKYKSLTVKINTSVRRFDTPKKLIKLVPWLVFGGASLALGFHAGSKGLRKLWRLYGNLGGGDGVSPVDEKK